MGLKTQYPWFNSKFQAQVPVPLDSCKRFTEIALSIRRTHSVKYHGKSQRGFLKFLFKCYASCFLISIRSYILKLLVTVHFSLLILGDLYPCPSKLTQHQINVMPPRPDARISIMSFARQVVFTPPSLSTFHYPSIDNTHEGIRKASDSSPLPASARQNQIKLETTSDPAAVYHELPKTPIPRWHDIKWKTASTSDSHINTQSESDSEIPSSPSSAMRIELKLPQRRQDSLHARLENVVTRLHSHPSIVIVTRHVSRTASPYSHHSTSM